MKHKILMLLCCILIFLAFEAGISCVTRSETKEYTLEEIKDGKYVVYQKTVSAVPAQNYEIAMLCIDGKIVTVEGSINFVFENDSTKKATIKRTLLAHGDTATIHISKDKVEFADVVAIQ